MVDEIKTGKKRDPMTKKLLASLAILKRNPSKRRAKNRNQTIRRKKRRARRKRRKRRTKRRRRKRRKRRTRRKRRKRRKSRKIKRSQANPSPTIPAPVVAQRQAVHRHLELNLYLEACKGMFTSCYSIFHLFFSLTNFFGRTRARWIAQKRAATMDAKSLAEILMVTS